MSQKYFQIYRGLSICISKRIKLIKKESHSDFFFQSIHQVGMKNVVKCYKDFFGYFNTLKTHGDISNKFIEMKISENVWLSHDCVCCKIEHLSNIDESGLA